MTTHITFSSAPVFELFKATCIETAEELVKRGHEPAEAIVYTARYMIRRMAQEKPELGKQMMAELEAMQ